MTTTRDAILQSIRSGRGARQTAPAYTFAPSTDDAVTRFTAKATACVARVHRIAAPAHAPEAILALLSEAGTRPRLHLPPESPLNNLPWQRAPGLVLLQDPPTGEDIAISAADFAVAETGTLVFLSGPLSHSSWHFRPGREIVLLDRALILPRMEDVFARLKGALPATLNFVTGPSRTADIEQTIELGAHGPRHLDILLTG